MSPEEIDHARAKEAVCRLETSFDFFAMAIEAAKLAREGWLPPRHGDLQDEAQALLKDMVVQQESYSRVVLEQVALWALARGRELGKPKASPEDVTALAKIIDPPAFQPSRHTGRLDMDASAAVQKARLCLRFLRIEDE